MNTRCLLELADIDSLRAHLRFISAFHHDFIAYKSFFEKARHLSQKNSACARGLQTQAAERAFGMETKVRMLIRTGMELLNLGRDSNLMQNLFDSEIGEKKQVILQSEDWMKIKHSAEKEVPGFDHSLLDLPPDLLQTYNTRIGRYSKTNGSIDVSYYENERERTGRIHLIPRAGSLGRVSVDDVLSEGKLRVISNVNGYAKCHGQPLEVSSLVEQIDFYEIHVALLLNMRDNFYYHARQVNELGLVAFTGGNPSGVGVVLIVIIVLAALALLGYNIYTMVKCAQEYGSEGYTETCKFALGLALTAGGFGFLMGVTTNAGGKYGIAASTSGSQPLTISVS